MRWAGAGIAVVMAMACCGGVPDTEALSGATAEGAAFAETSDTDGCLSEGLARIQACTATELGCAIAPAAFTLECSSKAPDSSGACAAVPADAGVGSPWVVAQCKERGFGGNNAFCPQIVDAFATGCLSRR